MANKAQYIVVVQNEDAQIMQAFGPYVTEEEASLTVEKVLGEFDWMVVNVHIHLLPVTPEHVRMYPEED